MEQRKVDIEERLPLLQSLPLSLQHLFAMFGATVLVPFLVGLDTSVTLFTSGLGTLVYIFITKGKIPAYLGSSFAFIAALAGLLGVKPGEIAPPDRIAVAMGGCVVVGACYLLVALAIAKFGTGWIEEGESSPVLILSQIPVFLDPVPGSIWRLLCRAFPAWPRTPAYRWSGNPNYVDAVTGVEYSM